MHICCGINLDFVNFVIVAYLYNLKDSDRSHFVFVQVHFRGGEDINTFFGCDGVRTRR